MLLHAVFITAALLCWGHCDLYHERERGGKEVREEGGRGERGKGQEVGMVIAIVNIYFFDLFNIKMSPPPLFLPLGNEDTNLPVALI